MWPSPPRSVRKRWVQAPAIKAYREQSRLGDFPRTFKDSRTVTTKWLKTHLDALPEIGDRLQLAASQDLLALDAGFSVAKKK